MTQGGFSGSALRFRPVGVQFCLLRLTISGNRDGQFAVDLFHPHRLVFEPNHRPLPRKDDGGIDTEQVTAITILDVIDYH